MTYKINKTDGSLLTEIIDSAIDTTATDLALIGKNVTGYGEYLNENFIKLLENFSSTSEPNNPVTGQIWFDVSENRLKVYDGNGFRIGSGPIVSATPPLNPIQGDFWIDSEENQLYFYDGVDRVLAGPIYKQSQGISGFQVESITDIDGNQRVILKLWAGGVNGLLGIFSKNAEFTPASLIPGFTGTVKPGFNVANVNGFKFHARATSADALIDSTGTLKPASSFMFSDEDNFTSGSITINNSEPLTLGTGQENTFAVSPSLLQIRSDRTGQDFKITTRRDVSGTATYFDALTIKAATNRVGIFNNDPQATLEVDGDVIINGDLTVENITSVNSTEISIDDINLVLGDTASPTDTTANGGGIILKGTGDKTLTYSSSNAGQWSSNQNFNIAAGKAYRINNVDVLSATTLASSVTTASGLTTIGTLELLTVDDVTINGSAISTGGSLNLQLNPAGNVDLLNTSRIINLQDPVSDQDAATKKFVTDTIAPVASPWITKNIDYLASAGQRIMVDTSSGSVTIILPKTPVNGDIIRLLDLKGTFDTDNLIVKRFREPNTTTFGGTSSGSATTSGVGGTGTYGTVGSPISPVNIINSFGLIGSGTGLEVIVQLTANGQTYTGSNTTVTVVSHGTGYKNGDRVQITGDLLGGTNPGSNFVFDLSLDSILSADEDFVITKADAGVGFVYVAGTPAQGWKYSENPDISGGVIEANLLGNVTGDVTGNVTGNLFGSVTGNVSGNLTGNVTGNVTGDVTGDLTGDVTGDVLGNLTGDVTGNVLGDLTGNVTGLSVSSPLELGLFAGRNIEMNVPVLLKGYDSSTRDTLSYKGLIYNTDLNIVQYYNSALSVWQNVGTDTSNSVPRFKLPSYSASEITTLSGIQAGEIIYNTDLNIAQVFNGTVWNNLW